MAITSQLYVFLFIINAQLTTYILVILKKISFIVYLKLFYLFLFKRFNLNTYVIIFFIKLSLGKYMLQKVIMEVISICCISAAYDNMTQHLWKLN